MGFREDSNIPAGPLNPDGQRFETVMLHAGQETPDPSTGARATPLYLTTSYVFGSCDEAADIFAMRKPGNIYSRLTNPTTEAFERRIAALEGATAALAVASGAAAIAYVVENLTRTGDHIVSANTIYGGTFNYFQHGIRAHGVECTFVDPTRPGTVGNFEAEGELSFVVGLKFNFLALQAEGYGYVCSRRCFAGNGYHCVVLQHHSACEESGQCYLC